MRTIEYTNIIDKSKWGDGEWNNEPDKVQWPDSETGLPCLAVRNRVGTWCGYVGITKEHPAFEKDYNDIDEWPEVHGGLTYADFCQENNKEHGVCHIVATGEDDRVWWLGFDCGHCGDLVPSMPELVISVGDDTYKTLDYVKGHCASLAKQLQGKDKP